MKNDKYDWSTGTPPEIDVHSLRKLEVYREYLIHYLQVLNSNPLIPNFGLTIVDGFSGGGNYTFNPGRCEEVIDGSPLVILDAIQIAKVLVQEKRVTQGVNKKITFDIDYHFVDKSQSAINYLIELLHSRGHSKKLGKTIFTYKNDFVRALQGILPSILNKKEKSKRRVIFILDQYGYSAVPFDSIKFIFTNLPNAEVILTFATDWLIEYLSDENKFKEALKKIGVGSDEEIRKLVNVKKESKEWRKLVQLALHDIIPNKTGAKFYTPFFIKSKKSKRSFWLVHLSNHPKARDVMTELHHNFQNTFEHYASAGAMMFGYDPLNDKQITKKIDIFKDDTIFNFDDYSRNMMMDQLNEELPRILSEYGSELSFHNLYSHLVNSTPATKFHIKEACSALAKMREISIRNGLSVRTAAKSIKDEDRIFLPAQFTLPFLKK